MSSPPQPRGCSGCGAGPLEFHRPDCPAKAALLKAVREGPVLRRFGDRWEWLR